MMHSNLTGQKQENVDNLVELSFDEKFVENLSEQNETIEHEETHMEENTMGNST
jgi:hypothetical protein